MILVVAIYFIGLLVSWLGFSYKKGCAHRRYVLDNPYYQQGWHYRATDWDLARVLFSLLWPISLLCAVIYFVGWVCLLQWPAKLVMRATRTIEQIGQTNGCPKISLDKS